MKPLQQQQCSLCRADSAPVMGAELDGLMGELGDWQLQMQGSVQQLEKLFSFSDYAEAMAFTQRIGDLAEAEDHHPAILTEWGKVRVTWWTHTIKGLHINDFICAAKTDQLAQN